MEVHTCSPENQLTFIVGVGGLNLLVLCHQIFCKTPFHLTCPLLSTAGSVATNSTMIGCSRTNYGLIGKEDTVPTDWHVSTFLQPFPSTMGRVAQTQYSNNLSFLLRRQIICNMATVENLD